MWARNGVSKKAQKSRKGARNVLVHGLITFGEVVNANHEGAPGEDGANGSTDDITMPQNVKRKHSLVAHIPLPNKEDRGKNGDHNQARNDASVIPSLGDTSPLERKDEHDAPCEENGDGDPVAVQELSEHVATVAFVGG